MSIIDWSSDVCSSDLRNNPVCIHILDRQMDCRAFQKGEFIVSHFLSDCSIIIRCQVTPLRLLFQPAVPLDRLQHRSPPQQQPPTDWPAWCGSRGPVFLQSSGCWYLPHISPEESYRRSLPDKLNSPVDAVRNLLRSGYPGCLLNVSAPPQYENREIGRASCRERGGKNE